MDIEMEDCDFSIKRPCAGEGVGSTNAGRVAEVGSSQPREQQ